MNLSLMEAIVSDSLDIFIEQKEARDVKSISENEFNATSSRVIKTRQLNDQTSYSPRHDNSLEK